MQIGLIGLGKMGFNLGLNMLYHKHDVSAFDLNQGALEAIAQKGVKTSSSIEQLLSSLKGKKVVWLMIPAGDPVDLTIATLTPLLKAGDIIIDGGNSNYKDSIRRSKQLQEKAIDFLDCGTSGGMEGALHGVCAMIGGKKEAFNYCEGFFKDISVPSGYLYCGASGSGHFVKMIHNGIEYGMMQSIAEGFEVLHKSEFDLNLKSVAGVWNHGSVVRSWLMELTENALSKDPKLEMIKGIMHSSGEGKWTLETALEKQIATPVIALSLMMRYRSLQDDTFSGKIIAALRNEFGGHAVEKK
ncbi:MAG: phosphogluconate dehydrogenase (NAD(+)-dependent, decarboxylating) [Cyclobacteriaceae bacterium]